MADLAAPVERTTRGIRAALFDELDAIRSGKSTPGRASSVAKIASQIVETMRAEIDVHRYLSGMDPKEREEMCAVRETVSLSAVVSPQTATTPILVPTKSALPPSSIPLPSKARLMAGR